MTKRQQVAFKLSITRSHPVMASILKVLAITGLSLLDAHEKGAATAMQLATLPDDGPTGIFHMKESLAW